jgi:hypothetical protein
VPGDGRERDVVAREQAAGRQQGVAGRHVLARGAHVRAGVQRPLDDQPLRALACDLHLRDGVVAVVHDLARVEAGVRAGRERSGARGGGDDRVAVHGGAAVRRVGRERDERLGQRAPDRRFERGALARQRRRPAGACERREPGPVGRLGLGSAQRHAGARATREAPA